MYRSFTDRVLAGVCGGLPLNSWLLRLVFIILTALTTGVFALVYLALWWILPQESPLEDQSGSFPRLVVAVGISLVILGAWFIQPTGPSGESLFLPIILLALSIVYLLQQVRA